MVFSKKPSRTLTLALQRWVATAAEVVEAVATVVAVASEEAAEEVAVGILVAMMHH